MSERLRDLERLALGGDTEAAQDYVDEILRRGEGTLEWIANRPWAAPYIPQSLRDPAVAALAGPGLGAPIAALAPATQARPGQLDFLAARELWDSLSHAARLSIFETILSSDYGGIMSNSAGRLYFTLGGGGVLIDVLSHEHVASIEETEFDEWPELEGMGPIPTHVLTFPIEVGLQEGRQPTQRPQLTQGFYPGDFYVSISGEIGDIVEVGNDVEVSAHE